METAGAAGRDAHEAKIAALWSGCAQGHTNGLQSCLYGGNGGGITPGSGVAQVPDFDVLSVIDHRMRWYNESSDDFAGALAAVVNKHRRSLFVGASMGGFGSLLHGANLADSVLAFGPQCRLDHATLRPPAATMEHLDDLVGRVCAAVRTAQARGARVEVHCAADEHCWHALHLPLADCHLTVHPLMPRKPFARLLDRAQLLAPIISDTIYHLLQAPGDARPAETREGAPTEGKRALIARWRLGGQLSRHTASRQELLSLLFGRGAPHMPRPGDWFCALCRRRNMSSQFFCSLCGVVDGACILDTGVAKIPGGRDYPRCGDWGCGKCGAALCAYQQSCTLCWASKQHERAIIAT